MFSSNYSQNMDDILAESSSHLKFLLGLSPATSSSDNNNVRTFQCGDMKFPDASTPLSKILDCVMGSQSQVDSKTSRQRRRFSSETNLLSKNDPPVTRSRTVSASGSLQSFDSSKGTPIAASSAISINRDQTSGSSSNDDGGSISPLSDAGYSINSGTYSGDAFIAQSARRSELPSIFDLDPAVAQAVIDLESVQTIRGDHNNNNVRGNHHNNLLNTLFGTDGSIAAMSRPRQEMDTSLMREENMLSRSNSLLAERQHLDYMFSTNPADPTSLDRAARLYRNAAALFDATCTWSGKLPPPRAHAILLYSCKIFLGGIPWDITESNLIHAFRQFGPIQVEWPVKNNSSPPGRPKGYVYVIFQQEKCVKALLSQCTRSYSDGGSWYYRISSRRLVSKEAQVIPWPVGDSNFVRCPSQQLDPRMTVFVGALHGMLNAEGLAHIFNDLFDGVVYAGIDTDRYKYPIGSGRVTFSNWKSYMKAVTAAFIEIKSPKFVKKVQVDPYLENALCATCNVKQGPYFCRDVRCFQYFCRDCWELQHSLEQLIHHRPLMRSSRAGGGPVTRPVVFLSQGLYGHPFEME